MCLELKLEEAERAQRGHGGLMNRLTVFMESAVKATLACSMWLSMSRWSNQSKSRKRLSHRWGGLCL